MFSSRKLRFAVTLVLVIVLTFGLFTRAVPAKAGSFTEAKVSFSCTSVHVDGTVVFNRDNTQDELELVAAIVTDGTGKVLASDLLSGFSELAEGILTLLYLIPHRKLIH